MSDEPLKATPADQAPPVNFKAARIAKLQAANRKMWEDVRAGLRPPPNVGRRRKTADAIAPATPPPDAPPPPPAPKPPGDPKPDRGLILAAKVRQHFSNALTRFPARQRIEMWLSMAESFPDVKDRDGYALGWLASLWDLFPACPRIRADVLRPVLAGLAPLWRDAMTPAALEILEGLPDVVLLYRYAPAAGKMGLAWCSSREAALAYSRLPALRCRDPHLFEALVDRSRLVHIREALGGFEAVALVEPSDITAESKL